VLALSVTPASAAEPCTNEKLRGESNTNPATGQPYSRGLPAPECRAYEMVSPLYKQAHGAKGIGFFGIAVAPGGETVGWGSEGDFAEPENYRVNFGFPQNPYLSRRGAAGWTTLSAFAPRNFVDAPTLNGMGGDLSPDLRSLQVSCGTGSLVEGEQKGLGFVCAKGKPGGPWVSGALHTTTNAIQVENPTAYLGGSSDLSRVFIEPIEPLLPEDTGGRAGIYELAGVGTAAEELRLVNVDGSGKVLRDDRGQAGEPPLIGDHRNFSKVEGSAYHAISTDGRTVFFSATPTKENEILTLYARVDHEHTVVVSNPSPSECTACALAEKAAMPATFQGASADGSKVFFTTEQQLLTSDHEGTTKLYEYDFKPPAGHPQLVQVSGDGLLPPGEGANVLGVVRTSSDGSHVYFVATGKLTSEKNEEGKEAMKGQANLYGYDTVTGQTKFVATLREGGGQASLWGENDEAVREAQTTPDGRYLVFSFPVQLAGDTNSASARAVYRYDFEPPEGHPHLTWISHAAPEFAAVNKGLSARVAALELSQNGGNVMINDWNKAISENGESIVFTTPEQLQESDTDGATDVYLWHNGTVSMISAGGGEGPAMSSSGSDIFFVTSTRLVGQDSDVLTDVYDAHVGGGFPAPSAEPSCSGDACQEPPKPPPSFGPVASSLAPVGGNLTPSNPGPPAPPPPPPKHLTEAQLLAEALATCKHKAKNKRAACELQARKRYGAQQFAQALKACKHKPKNRRAACERQARKRYGR
jgi:hypothetical protein